MTVERRTHKRTKASMIRSSLRILSAELASKLDRPMSTHQSYTIRIKPSPTLSWKRPILQLTSHPFRLNTMPTSCGTMPRSFRIVSVVTNHLHVLLIAAPRPQEALTIIIRSLSRTSWASKQLIILVLIHQSESMALVNTSIREVILT